MVCMRKECFLYFAALNLIIRSIINKDEITTPKQMFIIIISILLYLGKYNYLKAKLFIFFHDLLESVIHISTTLFVT